jgi:DeoR/GlpR family transcriptional regulator of sugar metabolism
MATRTQERRLAILEELARSQAVQVAELSQQFGVSEVSIRRDLAHLEQDGVLRRIHGGAVVAPHVSPVSAIPASAGPVARSAEKARIGRQAAALVQRGERLIFDSGTTVLQVAAHLADDLRQSGDLTVITGSLPVVRELGHCKGIHLVLLGGIYLPQYDVVVGPHTIEQIRTLHADKLFLGADGLTFVKGVTTANVLEAEVNRATISAATEVIVVADSSKIGLIGLTSIAPLTGIHVLISDTDAPADFVAELRRQGIEVILA